MPFFVKKCREMSVIFSSFVRKYHYMQLYVVIFFVNCCDLSENVGIDCKMTFACRKILENVMSCRYLSLNDVICQYLS